MLAALCNAMLMVALVAVIAWQAISRLQHPIEVKGLAVAGVALIGLAVNVVVFLILHRRQNNINVRGALLHVIGDLLGSVAALVSGLVIVMTGWSPIDPLLSLLICTLILVSALKLLRDAVHVVMEGVPGNLDLTEIRAAMVRIEHVKDIHDLHIWQVSSEQVALSAHVLIEEMAQWPQILNHLNRMLGERFAINHPTLQPEIVCAAPCDLRH